MPLFVVLYPWAFLTRCPRMGAQSVSKNWPYAWTRTRSLWVWNGCCRDYSDLLVLCAEHRSQAALSVPVRAHTFSPRPPSTSTAIMPSRASISLLTTAPYLLRCMTSRATQCSPSLTSARPRTGNRLATTTAGLSRSASSLTSATWNTSKPIRNASSHGIQA